MIADKQLSNYLTQRFQHPWWSIKVWISQQYIVLKSLSGPKKAIIIITQRIWGTIYRVWGGKSTETRLFNWIKCEQVCATDVLELFLGLISLKAVKKNVKCYLKLVVWRKQWLESRASTRTPLRFDSMHWSGLVITGKRIQHSG